MIVLQVQDLVKYFGEKQVLNQVGFAIEAQERVGLVGVNGSGKTTLLQCITGQLEPEAGSISRAKSLRIGYLRQMTGEQEERTLWEAAMGGFAHLLTLRSEMKNLEQKMATCLGEIPQGLAQSYNSVLQQYEQNQGYACESLARGILMGLGFPETEFSLPVQQLSGGQKTRLFLTVLLASQPDILILDEPTNHLDLGAVEWLENYLGSYRGTILFVSHDRMFMNHLATRIIALSQQQIRSYRGNYDQYQQQREAEISAQEKALEKQQAYIAKTEAYIERYRAGIKSKQAAGREKQLQRLERLSAPSAQQTIRPPKLQLQNLGGQQVVQVELDYCGYGEPLFQQTQLYLYQGERVGLIGPNGVGKSTLLKLITGELQPKDFPPGQYQGRVLWGSQITWGYFSQEFEGLHPENTLLQEVLGYSDGNIQEARNLLGSLLFSADAIEKKVHQLSGGEKARIALIKLILTGANFLILDEPTNHLDLESCAVVESLLQAYQGTLLLVSHDRYFLEQLVERIVAIEQQQLVSYSGSYAYYLEKRAGGNAAKIEENPVGAEGSEIPPQLAQPQTAAEKFRQEVKAKERRVKQQQKQIEKIEAKIQVLTQEKDQIEAQLADEKVFADYQKVEELHAVYQQVKTDLSQAEEEWLLLQEELNFPF